MQMFVRAREQTRLWVVSEKLLNKLMLLDPVFDKRVLMFQNNFFKQKRQYPMNVISCPPDFMKQEFSEKRLQRQTMLKNIVIDKLNIIRNQKKKPKLRAILEFCR